MFKSFSELRDVVSVLVHCIDDSTYMLITENNAKELTIPSSVVGPDSHWRLAAKHILKDCFSIDITENTDVANLYKIWLGDGQSFLYHAVFVAPISTDIKRKFKINNNTKNRVIKGRWVTDNELPQLCTIDAFKSPDMLNYLGSVRHKSLDVPRLKGHHRPSIQSVSWTELLDRRQTNSMVEVLEKHIVVGNTTADRTAQAALPYETLVEASGYSRADQCALYKEFLIRSFPSMYMSRDNFTNFMTNLKWSKEDLPHAFRTADVFGRGALSYRDLLFFVTATEPSTQHGGVPAELRCRYIFKFFDKDCDGKLDYKELKDMVMAVKKSKNEPVDAAAVNKETEAQVKLIGLKPEGSLLLKDFLRMVGELKFRGTSLLLRSPTSIKLHLASPSSSPSSSKEIVVAGGKGDVVLKKGASTSAPSPAPSPQPSVANSTTSNSSSASRNGGARPTVTVTSTKPSAPVGGTVAISKSKPAVAINGGDYELAIHCVKMKRTGTITDIDKLYEMDAAVSRSTNAGDKIMSLRLQSADTFDQKSHANELLIGLKYFAQPIPSTPKLGAKKPKEAYAWGVVDIQGFARCLINVCDKVRDIVKEEPRLLEVSSPVYVLGDIHGNYPDLLYFEKVLWHLGPSLTPSNLLFLGDYVDRGPNGVEVVAYLFAHKIQSPKKVRLLRGNHEVRDVQKMFTFHKECMAKFGEQLGLELWEAVNSVFDVLPIAAVIDGKVFCCHGGIPPPWLCSVIASINTIPTPLPNPDSQSPLAWDILWNDPVRQAKLPDNLMMELVSNEGFAVNSRRGTAHVFSYEALDKFLRVNGLTQVIRAHEVAQVGFQIQQRGRLVTVFSSSRYCGGSNEAACVMADRNKLRVFRLDTS